MRYLGVDYGKKKMGLAISEGVLASPLKVTGIRSLKDALVKTHQIVKQEGVEKVVVGIPESGEAMKIAKEFSGQLKKSLIGIEVIEVEETLSSQAAKQQMVDLNISQKKRQKEDAYAACLILQDYIDSV